MTTGQRSEGVKWFCHREEPRCNRGDVAISTDLDNFAELYTYPVAGAEYQTGENEDTRDCVDLYIFTDSWLFRIHVSVAADYTDDYKDMVGEWLTHLELVER